MPPARTRVRAPFYSASEILAAAAAATSSADSRTVKLLGSGAAIIDTLIMEGPWTSDEALASGQVFEDRIWALLTEQSRGHLHVFRPLLDRGVDGLLHRLADGAYIPAQATGRSSLIAREVKLVVAAERLTDDLVV